MSDLWSVRRDLVVLNRQIRRITRQLKIQDQALRQLLGATSTGLTGAGLGMRTVGAAMRGSVGGTLLGAVSLIPFAIGIGEAVSEWLEAPQREKWQGLSAAQQEAFYQGIQTWRAPAEVKQLFINKMEAWGVKRGIDSSV